MGFSDYLTIFFLVFLVIGAIDKCLDNKFGFGEGFDRGFDCAGSLVVAMVGFTCFAPVFAGWLQPVLTPFFHWMGADPAMFAGLIVANDSGGFPLAMSLAEDPIAGCYSGLLVASIMGCLVMFTIPYGFAAATREQRPLFIKGLLIGVVTVPLGLAAGGLFSGLTFAEWLCNTIPVLVISGILTLCIWLIPNIIAKVMMVVARILTVIVIITLVVAILDLKLPWIDIPNLVPYGDAILVIGEILIVLGGAFPFLTMVRKLFRKPLSRLAAKLDFNEDAMMGLLALPINALPTFAALPKMNDRGIVVVTACAVSMDFVIGDHLAFTLSVRPDYVPMVMVGKIVGGLCGLFLALWMTRPNKQKEKSQA